MNTVLSVKTDKTVKKQAMALAKEMGVPLSLVITSLLKKFVLDKELVIEAPRQISKNLEKIIAEAERDLRAGKVSPVFSKTKDAIAWLKV